MDCMEKARKIYLKYVQVNNTNRSIKYWKWRLSVCEERKNELFDTYGYKWSNDKQYFETIKKISERIFNYEEKLKILEKEIKEVLES